MPKQRLNRMKRKAAAKVFYFVFSQLGNLAHQLTFSHLEHEWDAETDLFTEKERLYVRKLQKRLHEDSQMCLHFAWRLDGRRG